ncbi:MAG TPA: phosphatidate cytidylyltransferase [Oscillospiraceae bacterium]|nr:phosphatidate cytidylyltransferase [Oscillospiraceae bacterium]HNW04852.1 phosphatidate cytidylyltransferase [Oscillospiraceae bacterium]HPW00262.1 phosphatidate cytidylyltransferase [Oscillospiraceae bacterium]
MKQRLITSLVGLALLGVVLYFYNTVLLDIAVTLVSVIAVWELLHAGRLGDHIALVSVCLAAAAVVSSRIFAEAAGLREICLFFGGMLMLAVLFDRKKLEATAAGYAFFVSITVPLGFSTALLYREGAGPAGGLYITLLSFAVAWLNDTFAFFSGSLFGRHKLYPEISPKKTVEGAVGGVIGSVAFCLLLSWAYAAYAAPALGEPLMLRWPSLCLFLPVGAGAGILGDLSASAIKRQFGVKDYGNIMPGHGGVMDRFDSWLFVAPLLYLWDLYFPIF